LLVAEPHSVQIDLEGEGGWKEVMGKGRRKLVGRGGGKRSLESFKALRWEGVEHR